MPASPFDESMGPLKVAGERRVISGGHSPTTERWHTGEVEFVDLERGARALKGISGEWLLFEARLAPG